MVLLLSQVFVLSGLKTHGYHLCARQHLAAFDAVSTFQSRTTTKKSRHGVFILGSGGPCRRGRGMMMWVLGSSEDGDGLCLLPAACTLTTAARQTPPLHEQQQRFIKARGVRHLPVKRRTLLDTQLMKGWLTERDFYREQVRVQAGLSVFLCYVQCKRDLY